MRPNSPKSFRCFEKKNTHMAVSNQQNLATVVGTEVAVPGEKTLKHAARIAIEQDKPVMFDYYTDTRDGKAFLGEDAVSKDKMLVRSEDEYTSLIQKIFKVAEDFIVITENSIYIIAGSTKKKTITAPTQ